MLSNYLEEINNFINIEYFLPEIGHYFLEDKDFLKIKTIAPDKIFIVDIALQKKDVIKLKSLAKDLLIFDHHKQEKIKNVKHFNPLTDFKINSLQYPSTGWVINGFFKKDQDILSVLGAIGDQESRVMENSDVKRIFNETGFSFTECTNIVKSIDSFYITGNVEEIHMIIKVLKNGINDIRSILTNTIILKNKEIISNEINKVTNEGFSRDNLKKIIIKRLKSKFNIISEVSRKMSAEFPDYLVITIDENNNNLANIYFRTGKLNADLTPIINYAKNKSYNTGGKKEVVGIFCPYEKINEVINDSINILIS